MAKISSLSLLIPAFNDEATIETVVKESVSVGRRVAKKFEIVVIDDGSKDMTGLNLVTLAKKFKGLRRVPDGTRLRIITHRVNQGYGRTIKELYYAGKYEWLFTIPGDYQIGAKELETLISSSDSSDMILGWRVKRNDPANRLVSSWIYNTLLRFLFGITIHDINSVRLMRRSILKNITLTSNSAFVDAELVIRAKRLGYTIAEVPITHRSRSDGKSGGGNQWGTMVATIVDMLRFFI